MKTKLVLLLYSILCLSCRNHSSNTKHLDNKSNFTSKASNIDSTDNSCFEGGETWLIKRDVNKTLKYLSYRIIYLPIDCKLQNYSLKHRKELFASGFIFPQGLNRDTVSSDAKNENFEATSDEDIPYRYYFYDTIDNLNLKTILEIYPPRETGEGEGNYWANIVIEVNGYQKINCTIGKNYSPMLFVKEIDLCPQTLIALYASSLEKENHLISLPDNILDINDKTMITDELLLKTLKNRK